MNRKTFLFHAGSLLVIPAIVAHTSCKHDLPQPQPGWFLEVNLDQFLLNVQDVVVDTVRGIYVKRIAAGNTPASFICFSLACTHSGCTVALQANGEFHCPCHGSKFNADGTVITGPAARPLDTFKVTIQANLLRVSR